MMRGSPAKSGLLPVMNMKTVFEFVKGALAGQNQFASGGLLLMLVGSVSVWLRAVPEKIWYWIVRQTTMLITVNDDDAAFVWVKEWFLEQKFLKRIRHVDLDTTMRNERIAMIPAPGCIGSGTEVDRFRCGSRVPKSRVSARPGAWSR